MSQHELFAISPIDGRYASKTADLQEIASEHGLISRRVEAMAGYFGHLQSGVLPDVDPISDGSQDYLRRLVDDFDVVDAEAIKSIEKATKHDVKAVEVWLREKISRIPELHDNAELIHFGCTSEDVNSLAYGMMFNDVLEEIVEPTANRISDDVHTQADEWKGIPLLSLTHGQPATPTTVGKEISVFAHRLGVSRDTVMKVPVFAKWSGATGNYAAATIAYPDVDWRSVNRQFVESFDIEYAEPTTQIEPHDYMVRIFNEIGLSNSIKIDLARDMWGYIQRGVFGQKTKVDEVGSSTMPHKVNPIDFENAEANFGIANAIASHLAQKLPVSRYQRDLSDSSALRATGEVFGHTQVADSSLLRGLGKITINETNTATELDANWAVLTEAVQTVMRRYGVENAYTIIKEATRGVEFGRQDYVDLVTGLNIPIEARHALRELTPSKYVGLSAELAE